MRTDGERPIRVLIASHSLGAIGGVQTYERDLAEWLLGHGHAPVVYSTVLGESSRQLDRLTVPVTTDLASVGAAPDIIHGDSAVETMAALLHFPAVPALFVCHGWNALVPHFPRILRYVAVDDTCADFLLTREGIAPEKVVVLLNAVDTRRFPQRPPLPERPRRAIVFSNTAHEGTYLPFVREACHRNGIEVDVAGLFAGNTVSEPEALLPGYDLAFAKAKCTIEAMACGLAVIVCDARGIGGMVRTDNLERLRRLNFGARCLNTPWSADALAGEIAKYDPADAREVSGHIRATASSDTLHGALFAQYEAVIAGHDGHQPDGTAEGRAAAAFLRRLSEYDRDHQGRLDRTVRAAHRLMQIPVLGPVARRAARWILRRR
ncbi:MAG TPA: glycosyltransferase [Thermoanaerobaculia bacterium]|nr:glycosyltransferase [Thermoanaerobaculia bacterium]